MPISNKIKAESLEALEDQLTVALKEIGFGVLNTIDFQETLKEKIGEDIGEYKLLQICNPHLAHQAIELEPSIGIQLPCNVLVRKADGAYVVDVQSPLDSIPSNAPEELNSMANELTKRIEDLLVKL
jgi:uncharacterized protein (DUF302 family)